LLASIVIPSASAVDRRRFLGSFGLSNRKAEGHDLPVPTFCAMLSLSAGAESLQASNDPVLSESDIRNVATDAIRNAARVNLAQGLELAETFLHRAEALFRRAEGSARLTQVLLIEYGSLDDEKTRAYHCTVCLFARLAFLQLLIVLLQMEYFEDKHYRNNMIRIGAILRRHKFDQKVPLSFIVSWLDDCSSVTGCGCMYGSSPHHQVDSSSGAREIVWRRLD
jgi:hypothetical protein